MSLRISSALAACGLLLAGCSPTAGALPGDAVECALASGGALVRDCTLEREDETGRFILYHPDGGFRRFALDPETLVVTAADGAERVSDVASDGEQLAFALGDARYRMPLRLLAGER